VGGNSSKLKYLRNNVVQSVENKLYKVFHESFVVHIMNSVDLKSNNV